MTIKVVLVDDHMVVIEGLSRMIEHEKDIDVVGKAMNGFEAVEVVEHLQPDVVVLDINMPQLNGVEATKQIKKQSPKTEVLILTMFEQEEYLFSVIRAGASGYLLKDSPSEEVIQAIRIVARGESMLHPMMAKKLINEYSGQPHTTAGFPETIPSFDRSVNGGGTMSPHQTSLNEDATSQQAVREMIEKKESISPRERDVLKLLVNGKTNKEIAEQLFISEKTVKIHLNKIYKKLGVKSRSQAIIEVIQNNML